MTEEEFRCRAINDYYASVTDELDLKEGAYYTIMQTSPSGWWYAVNDDGEDGWVPSNYLERVDDDEAGGDINEEGGNIDDDYKNEPPPSYDDDVVVKSNMNNMMTANDNNDNGEDELNEEEEMEFHDEEPPMSSKGSKISSSPQPSQPQHQQGKQSVVSQVQQSQQSHQVKQSVVSQAPSQAAQQHKQSQSVAKQPQSQQVQHQPSQSVAKQSVVSKPQQAQQQQQQQPKQQQQQQQAKSQQQGGMKTMNGGGMNMNVDDGAPDKPITEWTVAETLEYLQYVVTLDTRNDFKLTQAARYLTQLATNGDNCKEILMKGGLDIIFEAMRATAGDVAIQMSCCAAIVVLCANPNSKTYPAKTNGIYQISQGIKDNMNYRPFVVLAFNAVCNFCHDHPTHRNMAFETDIVDQIITGMEQHRGKTEGYRVHSAGCLALRNIAADPKGQATVGPNGVKTIVNGLNEYKAMKEVVEGSMGVLCNLCALPANGEAFVMGGGISLLDSIFDDGNATDNVRLAAASVLHNLAANPDTALLLSADEGIDLVVKILKLASVDSILFLNTLKVLAALLFKLPEDNKFGGNKKPEVMSHILQKGIAATLNEAVQYDNKELQEMSATLLVVIAQTSPKLAQQVADYDCPSHLIQPCMHDPSNQTLHCSFAIFFHVADAFQNQQRLVEKGIFGLLGSNWYERDGIRDDTIRIACGIYIKLLSNVKNAQQASQNEQSIQNFINWCKENKPNLKELCNAIEGTLKQLDPTLQELHVQESYSAQPNNNKGVQNNNNNNNNKVQGGGKNVQAQQGKGNNNNNNNNMNKNDEDEKYAAPQEVKKIGKQSKVQGYEDIKPQVDAGPADASGKTHDEDAIPNYQDNKEFYSIEDIVSGKAKLPQDQKEIYLTDSDFKKVFGMDKPSFYELRPWKQKSLKKSKGFF